MSLYDTLICHGSSTTYVFVSIQLSNFCSSSFCIHPSSASKFHFLISLLFMSFQTTTRKYNQVFQFCCCIVFLGYFCQICLYALISGLLVCLFVFLVSFMFPGFDFLPVFSLNCLVIGSWTLNILSTVTAIYKICLWFEWNGIYIQRTQ